ncbi:MAG: replicative DNA helicase [candidate division Zixibacteria bacterium]
MGVVDLNRGRNIDRQPPNSLDAEQAVLGSMLTSESAIGQAIEVLQSSRRFYSPGHRKIFDAIIELYDKSSPADIVTVSNHLEKNDMLEDCGGRTFITELADGVATSANVAYYAKNVLEPAILRDTIIASMEIIDLCYRQEDEADEILDQAEQKIFDISHRTSATEIRSYADIASEIIADYDERKKRGNGLAGLSTGYPDLDYKLSGLKPGNMYVLAGRPSMGKTALAVNILNNACQGDHWGLLFSLEMSQLDISKRTLYSLAGVPFSKADRGQLSDAEAKKVAEAMGAFTARNVKIDDSSSLTPLEIRAKARRFAGQHNLAVIVVDYIQLMCAKGETQNLQIAEISKQLKAMSKELNVPVIAISQLNRKVESRESKRPNLGDLRDSGAIEQDADVVMFVHRPWVYESHKPENQQSSSISKTEAEIIIGKNRNGPTGAVPLYFDEETMTFRSHSKRGDF